LVSISLLAAGSGFAAVWVTENFTSFHQLDVTISLWTLSTAIAGQRQPLPLHLAHLLPDICIAAASKSRASPLLLALTTQAVIFYLLRIKSSIDSTNSLIRKLIIHVSLIAVL
jgi:hypothetical protein